MTPSISDDKNQPPHGDNSAALDRADAACRARGASLTAIRREVLELLYSSPTGVKAYDLLARIKEAGPGASPPTVYRALSTSLAAAGHRLESPEVEISALYPKCVSLRQDDLRGGGAARKSLCRLI